MAGDPRHPNFFRRHQYGNALATFGRVVDENTDSILFTSDDFSIHELRDEQSGKISYAVKLYDYAEYSLEILNSITLVIYKGARYERESSELKPSIRPRAHYVITTIRTMGES